ncbi:MAG: hypothetical protein ACTTK0_05355 [Stomatobaculum sp.]
MLISLIVWMDLVGTIAFAISGAMASVAGALATACMWRWTGTEKLSAFFGAGTVILLRYAAAKRKWNLPRLSGRQYR